MIATILLISLLFSLNSINVFIPLLIILILIAAAAGSMRGFSVFNLFGIATFIGVGQTAGKHGTMAGKTGYDAQAKTPSQKGFNPVGSYLSPKSRKERSELKKYKAGQASIENANYKVAAGPFGTIGHGNAAGKPVTRNPRDTDVGVVGGKTALKNSAKNTLQDNAGFVALAVGGPIGLGAYLAAKKVNDKKTSKPATPGKLQMETEREGLVRGLATSGYYTGQQRVVAKKRLDVLEKAQTNLDNLRMNIGNMSEKEYMQKFQVIQDTEIGKSSKKRMGSALLGMGYAAVKGDKALLKSQKKEFVEEYNRKERISTAAYNLIPKSRKQVADAANATVLNTTNWRTAAGVAAVAFLPPFWVSKKLQNKAIGGRQIGPYRADLVGGRFVTQGSPVQPGDMADTRKNMSQGRWTANLLKASFIPRSKESREDLIGKKIKVDTIQRLEPTGMKYVDKYPDVPMADYTYGSRNFPAWLSGPLYGSEYAKRPIPYHTNMIDQLKDTAEKKGKKQPKTKKTGMATEDQGTGKGAAAQPGGSGGKAQGGTADQNKPRGSHTPSSGP